MEKENKLYEGKAKIIYSTSDPSLVIQYFKDDATAFDATKRGTIIDKGVYNNKISTAIFKLLEKEGIERIQAKDQLFDPNLHEAVAAVETESSGATANTVVQVLEPGYRLGGRLLRPARVVVAV